MSEFFPPNSRYYSVPLRKRVRADGTVETFVGRRIIPAMERYRALDRHRTIDDDRIDNVAAAAFGDPELYWRICDANAAMPPNDLVAETGKTILIPRSE